MVDIDELKNSLYLEGLANEIIHIIQKQRKLQNFDIMDKIEVTLSTEDSRIVLAAIIFIDKIQESCRIEKISFNLF